ncbi:HD domain-containing protein [Anaerosinus massiliensis]|uniref:HD domain-containing protein n=1 Tax=Massilibacillus massiliensis TaxID=1806837 RepID=UPI000A473237|nr:HD domain-containing protein [Massilibacillus massiliensis]
MKEKFLSLLRSTNRDGIENFINYLENQTDFFTAPASTKYHGAYEGGLLEHSLDVYDHMSKLCHMYELDDISEASVIITSLLHDICKVNFYKIDYRNRKNEKGVWEQVAFYRIDDTVPLGHGEKSVIMLQQFIALTLDEIMAIRWHMGSFSGSDYTTTQSLSKAMEQHRIVTLLHMADLAAGYLDNRR